MAASSSDESSAPENFQVSTTSTDAVALLLTTTGQSRLLEDVCMQRKCPLCRLEHGKFYCKNCVKAGNIVHSAWQQGESLTEKQQHYFHLQSGLKVFSNRYERLIKDQKCKENIEFEIKRKQKQLLLLQQLNEQKKVHLQELSLQHSALREANAQKRQMLPKYPLTVQKLKDFVLDHREKISEMRKHHNSQMHELKLLARRNIQQLEQYIFPISEIVLKDEIRQRAELNTAAAAAAAAESPQTIAMENETIAAALADAKNTSYIRGKWVFHGSGISEMQYRIVAPSLPANGDYSAYLDWLSDNKDDVPKTTATEITPSRISGFRIVGALTYATQLTQLMSYYLNVRLPHKVVFADFCRKLNEETFTRKVSRLNSNIMYLAYTQQVKLRSLNENHTLENILAILDLERSDLGRHGHHEISNAPLMKSVDSILVGIEATTTESESEDENSIRLDWESIPNLPNQQELINVQSTIPEGLMTSAANRITSMFRWMKKE